MPEKENRPAPAPEGLEERKLAAKAGRDKVQGLRAEDTLHRVGVDDGVVLPTLMGWGGPLDPNDTSRVRYLEEVAEELGTPTTGPENEPRSPHHRRG
ncbi:MAG: hypothetical protein QME79_04190 [Bacillota bacterium]|nr:hypothetical protein [Bacillota bacterium]